MIDFDASSTRGTISVVRLTLSLTMGLGLLGCEDVLEVELPSRLEAEALQDPSLIPILVSSVQADFECAYSAHVQFSGAFADEWLSANSDPNDESQDIRANRFRRAGTGGCSTSQISTASPYYRPLHTARIQGERAYEIISETPDGEVPGDKVAHLATIASYTGYAYTLLGEAFCQMAIDGGPRMEREEVLQIAEEWFTTALDVATPAGKDDLIHWASVGRARVRVNLGDKAGALADATRVPAGFRKNATYDAGTGRRRNGIYDRNVTSLGWTLDPSFRGLQIDGVPDSRLQGIDLGKVGQDPRVPLWSVSKFQSASDPIPLATWEEAQLIIAEIQRGQEAVDAINRIRRAADPRLPAFSSSDPNRIWAEVLEERRRVLFGQGHRISDLIRFPELQWQTGVRPVKGDQMADEFRCLPLPLAEVEANPNL